MITDKTYQIEQAKIEQLFQEAGWKVELVPNYERIERVAERAMFENVMRDTTTFIFMSFGTVIHGMVGAAFGCVVGADDIDYKA